MAPTSLPRFCLIACSASKGPVATPAAELYRGDVFRKALAWAQREAYTEVAILSARYGLVPLHQVVEPYDASLTTATLQQRWRWAAHVLAPRRRGLRGHVHGRPALHRAPRRAAHRCGTTH